MYVGYARVNPRLGSFVVVAYFMTVVRMLDSRLTSHPHHFPVLPGICHIPT